MFIVQLALRRVYKMHSARRDVHFPASSAVSFLARAMIPGRPLMIPPHAFMRLGS